MFTATPRPLQRGSLAALSSLALALGADAALAAPGATTTYRVIQLSTTVSTPDINARGQVVFTELLDGTTPRAIFYDGRTRQDIGTLGGPTAFASAFNEAGQVIGIFTTR